MLWILWKKDLLTEISGEHVRAQASSAFDFENDGIDLDYKEF